MKAKLLRGVPISDTETLTIGAEVEIVDGYCGTDGYYYMCKLSNGMQIGINSNHLCITDLTPYIDWEQRRYEIAKSIIQGMAANPELTCSNDYTIEITKSAVAYADALIKELKGE